MPVGGCRWGGWKKYYTSWWTEKQPNLGPVPAAPLPLLMYMPSVSHSVPYLLRLLQLMQQWSDTVLK